MNRTVVFISLLFLSITLKSQVNLNFESGVLTGWLQVPDLHWQASTTTPLSGSYSLKHIFNSSLDATDKISIALPSWNPNSGNISWQFKIRHGYDPSASNRWWVFLMSDMDANQMNTGGGCSGYAVGVNVTGSDDLLKIWRFDNGTPTVVLASTLNWQTQIGKTVAGAIEVDRKSDGTFTLKASTTGSFSNSTIYGSTLDNIHSSFYYFGICYSYTSSADQLLWVDDIALNYTSINNNDLSSEVLNPTVQVGSGIIPSTITSQEQALDVLKFQIKDNSTSDLLPTRVKSLIIKKATSNNSANWLNSIGGIRLRSASSEISILNRIITDNKIEIFVDSSSMEIQNDQSKEFTLSLYLKPDNLVDGTTLKLMIDSTNHGFETGLSGSGFANTFSRRIISNSFSISVDASKIVFSQKPTDIAKNSPFSLTVAAADNAGNFDKDFNNSVSLSLVNGIGIIAAPSGLAKSAVSGIAIWNDLTYNSRGIFEIQAATAGFWPISTGEIQVANDTNSVITPSESQLLGGAISSLSCYPSDAVEVLRFRINDQGTSDGVPTIVRNIRISRTENETAASLTKSIGGVLVSVDDFPISLALTETKTGYFTISFSEDNLVIPDGGFVDASIRIYFKDEGLTDNQTIQLRVDAINHGCTTDSQGSGFVKTFPSQIISNIFSITVNATRIKLANLPTRVGVMKSFSVAVSAVDLNGNIDKDYSGPVNISLLSGNGELINPLSSTGVFSLGSFTFNSLKYSKPENFSLLLVGPPLLSAVSPIITCGDSDGGIKPIALSSNSAIINSNCTSEQNAVEVIRFKIFDGGTSDEMPLLPTKINLSCFDPTKAALLNRQIAGFVLKANENPISIESYALNNGVFEIYPKLGSFVIPDGDTITISILVYLKRGEIIDNFNFQFFIPASNHGWEALSTSTVFSPNFSSTIYGFECKMQVNATVLNFSRSPFTVAKNSPFTLEVVASDAFGSIDQDFEDQITLGLNFGSGGYTCSTLAQNLNKGVCVWADVTIDNTGSYQFKVNGQKLNSALSDKIYCGIDNSCLVEENFENSITQSWIGSDDWIISTISPLDGIKSLQHKPKSTSCISVLSIPITFPIVGDKILEWNFTVRNGDWDPTTENYFYYVLMSNSSALASDKAIGYAIGINPSSWNDFITLWYFEDGKRTPLITTHYDWNENDEVSIRVGLTTLGEWKLWYKPKISSSILYGGNATSYYNDQLKWSGLVYGCTSSRTGQLWLDDLNICVSDYPPIIKSAKPINLNSLRVIFSEPVNNADGTNKENYKIYDKDGVAIKVLESISGKSVDNEFVIRTEKIPFGKLLLRVNHIGDLNGNSIDDSIYFGLGESGSLGRIIINEIMASPIPSVGLAENEYIELYNPAPDSVFLNGWKVQFDSKTINLPPDTILPKEYAILCSTSSEQILRIHGKSIGVKSFPSLLNSGMMIKLFDSNGSLISFVKYSDTWYGDEGKKDGGWSLEKLDTYNLVEGKNNWTASMSPKGGTPCSINSVSSINPDITSPTVLWFEVLNEHQLRIQFSEPMDSLMITFTSNFNVDQSLGNPSGAVFQGDDYSCVLLTFSESISKELIYNLCINYDVTDFTGNHLFNECILFSLPQTPEWNDIVINEVLFNPFDGGVDFVEIYNRSRKSVDLNKLLISNRNSKTNQLEQIYNESDTSRLLFPNEYAVITTDPKSVKQFYYAEDEKAFVKVTNLPSLNTDKGCVVLLDSNLNAIDELRYSEEMHFKLLSDFKGISLERINPNLESSSSSNWHSASQIAGFATPTYKNSQWVDPSQGNDEFVFNAETFSPDGDGKDDYLLASYKLPSEGFVANIRIFDSSGREVRRLASGMIMGTEGTLTWDGLNSKNQRVPIGIYIVYIEYFNLKGEVKKIKKTCVVAEKL